MPSEHLRALADAIIASTGVTVQSNSKWFDDFFSANGIRPPKGAAQLLTEEGKKPFSIVWGTAGMVARDALVDLLSHSSTTLSWRLLCSPARGPQTVSAR